MDSKQWCVDSTAAPNLIDFEDGFAIKAVVVDKWGMFLIERPRRSLAFRSMSCKSGAASLANFADEAWQLSSYSSLEREIFFFRI